MPEKQISYCALLRTLYSVNTIHFHAYNKEIPSGMVPSVCFLVPTYFWTLWVILSQRSNSRIQRSPQIGASLCSLILAIETALFMIPDLAITLHDHKSYLCFGNGNQTTNLPPNNVLIPLVLCLLSAEGSTVQKQLLL